MEKFEISEIGYTIDNTSKTRAIFEINKGVNKNTGYDVNAKIKEGNRRVLFKNMIYIADGSSDVPAFSVIKKVEAQLFAIYPKSDLKAFQQVGWEKITELICMQKPIILKEQLHICGLQIRLWIGSKYSKWRKSLKLLFDSPKTFDLIFIVDFLSFLSIYYVYTLIKEEYFYDTIKYNFSKWGNGQGIRLPKTLLEL